MAIVEVTDKVTKVNKHRGINKLFSQVRGYHTSAIISKDVASIKTKNHDRFIKPLTSKKVSKNNTNKIDGVLNTFSTMDLETMDFKGKQIPVAISLSMVLEDKSTKEYFFMINYSELEYVNGVVTKESLDKVTDSMWMEFINFVKSNKNPALKTIFVHNLGSFDGLFIFKNITRLANGTTFETLIDGSNEFIKFSVTISKGFKINWIDSCRIFPISLDKLCKTFGVEGKTQKYDMSKFNNFNLFFDKEALKLFKEYSIQDSKALAEALKVAQSDTYKNYTVDITECLSASNLAMKIFRKKFQEIEIPVLKSWEDSFIRESYFGGATDVYRAIAKKLYYLDVNSLYPFSMLKDMPLNLIERIIDPVRLKLIDLDEFFGFVKVVVRCPKSVKRPMLPVKFKGKTIYPTGTWIGTYFSEELKEINKLKLGYTFEIIEAHAYTKGKIFNKFVEHFFKIKKEAAGVERYLAKLCLNSLYGMFGRKLDVDEVVVTNTKGLYTLATYIVKNIIQIDKDLYLVITQKNIAAKTLLKLNTMLRTQITGKPSLVNSNVAIASAVTAYGRILMMKYKINPAVTYSDTDSVFTTDIEPFNDVMSNELGDFKDEMAGVIIQEGVFLGIKQYGYWFFDQEGNKVVKTVFAGVKRDSLTFEQILELKEGGQIVVLNKNRFFKSLANFSIQIKSTNTTIKQSNDKKLVNNEYLPKNIYFTRSDNSFFENLKVAVLKSYDRLVKSLSGS